MKISHTQAILLLLLVAGSVLPMAARHLRTTNRTTAYTHNEDSLSSSEQPSADGKQEMAALWLSLPEEYTPYLSDAQRQEMVVAYDIGVEPRVENALQGTSYIDTLTANYARIILSSPHDVQLLLLPQEEGEDSLVAVIESYSAPATQSSITFYSRQWQRLPADEHMPSLDASALLVQRPDTMSISTYKELVSWVEPTMLALDYHPDTEELEVSLSIPLVAREEKEQVSALLTKLTLKWDKHSFVNCY